MTRYALMMTAALILAACGDAQTPADANGDAMAETTAPSVDATSMPAVNAADAYEAKGSVLILVDRLVPEPDACLLMMSVVNGTDDRVTAGLFAFDVTGNGETAGANMFPQTAEAGAVKTAQIVLPGADCANAQMIEGGQINCRISDTEYSCVEITELRDEAVPFSVNE
ncbi:MAG: hypothetical protein AAF926_05245 [Pseudomonadota bacterium]